MKWEDRIQTVIMLFMGVAAGAVSFTHVHDATVLAGQPSWVGWVNAVTIELMVIALGLEVRRRRRSGGHKVKSVMAMMMFFIFLSMGAQVLDAEPTIVGWLGASASALGFLTLVKVVLSRPAEAKSAGGPVQDEPIRSAPASQPESAPIDVASTVVEPHAVAAEPASVDDAFAALASFGEGR
ncbi:DUF2637 domain-containing protein [Glycomyces tritici]|uniref:DUF2637 domain-containing protein n=1 Tax=Glycomyces tritici TaxID=2665176 RepID=A0ABT7YPL2_9ACTN|nr:DUF2637 domain-containing protein [Glycomyces tritici]MDN3240540.1 DUF2637 domain-containing protein [Glycomyces tritici]